MMIAAFPLTGVGLNAFRSLMPLLAPSSHVSPAIDVAHAHNIFLQTALDLGLPGLCAYLALLGVALANCVRIANGASPVRRDVALALAANIAAVHLFGLTDAVPLGAKVGLLFWISLGLVAALSRERARGEAGRRGVTPVNDTVATHRPPSVRIAPASGLSFPDLGEVWRHRELLQFLVWRDVKVRYKQTVLGAGWAVLQPFLTMIVFSVVFGRLAQRAVGRTAVSDLRVCRTAAVADVRVCPDRIHQQPGREPARDHQGLLPAAHRAAGVDRGRSARLLHRLPGARRDDGVVRRRVFAPTALFVPAVSRADDSHRRCRPACGSPR